jgi:phage virion morphogenesis protein
MYKIDQNTSAIVARLDELVRAGTDLRPILPQIGGALVASTQLRFKDQKGPDGVAWAPLGDVTRYNRAKRAAGGRTKGKRGKPTAKFNRALGGPMQALLDTGRLRNSITYLAGADFVEVGTNVVYASTHQFGAKQGAFGRTRRGGPIPWGDIPARPFLGLSAEDEADILRLLGNHLVEA